MSETPIVGQSDVETKIAIGKQKKDVGDQAFKAGQIKDGQLGLQSSSFTILMSLLPQLCGHIMR
jgi:hypothetical protein